MIVPISKGAPASAPFAQVPSETNLLMALAEMHKSRSTKSPNPPARESPGEDG